MPTAPTADDAISPASSRQSRSRRRRRRSLIVVLIVLGVLIAVGALTAYVGQRGLEAKRSMESAQQRIAKFREVAGQPDAPSLTDLHQQLQADTSHARAQTVGAAWSVYEYVPILGRNLRAFRQTTELVDTFVRDGVGPMARAADGLSVNSLKPRNGKINIKPLKRLTPAVRSLDDATKAASTSIGRIDTSGLLPQLATPIGKLKADLAENAPKIANLRKIVPILYPALGGEGTRHYLLIFQSNAEERASGGNPASQALLTVKNGAVKLGLQATSSAYPHPYKVPPYTPSGPGNEDWDRLYGKYAAGYSTNITMTPDFPSTAKMARAMWLDQVDDGPVDGVISFDPVALSYLMKATGPITLEGGQRIDAHNAVRYLLYGVYAENPDSKVQDAIFSSAARSIFKAVTSGKGEPGAYLDAFKPAIAEQRLKVWSNDPKEQALLLSSPLGNMLPPDNKAATVLGVYNNDDATSKMSFFMRQRVTVTTETCQGRPVHVVTTTVTNTLKPSQVSSLPEYVKPHQKRLVPGGDRQWVQLYGPVGGQLKDVYIEDQLVVWGTNYRPSLNTNPKATGVDDERPAVAGRMHGRPVGVVSIKMGPKASRTVKATFLGNAGDNPTVKVSHTPQVARTPVTVAARPC